MTTNTNEESPVDQKNMNYYYFYKKKIKEKSKKFYGKIILN